MYSTKYIAQSFVKQYYEILSAKPQELYKFYVPHAAFLHAEASSVEDSVTGIDAIRGKVELQQLAGAQIDLSKGSVDFQEFDSNRILVVVIGVLTTVDRPSRQFTQSFVLAGQNNNYFVSNSVFRLLDQPSLQVAAPVAVVAPVVEVTPTVEETLPVEEIEPEPVVETISVTETVVVETVPESATLEVEDTVVELPVVSEEPEATVAVDITEETVSPASENTVNSESEVIVAEGISSNATSIEVIVAAPVISGAPKSYLDIVKKTAANGQSTNDAIVNSNGYRTYKPKVTAVAVAQSPISLSPVTPTESTAVAESKTKYIPNYHDFNKATGQQLYSVYVSNLPEQVTESQLQQAFAHFGTVVQVDVTRGKKYAFVKFDLQSSMQAALDNEQPVEIGGVSLRVEERTKSTSGNGNGNKDAGKDKKQFRDRKYRDVKENGSNKEGNKDGDSVGAGQTPTSGENKEKKPQRKDDRNRYSKDFKKDKEFKKENKSSNAADSSKK